MTVRSSRTPRLLFIVALTGLLAMACSLGVVSNAPTTPNLQANRHVGIGGSPAPSVLGTASGFAVLGGPGVTLTRTPVTGDVGTGFPGAPVVQDLSPVTGTVHQGDTASIEAYSDFLLAYTAVGATVLPANPTHHLTGTLAGVTLLPGSYYFDAAATLTGVLTLDARGNANATWLIRIGTSGTGALTGTSFSVVMANGGNPCNVTWWVAEAVTMTTSSFQGTLLAGAAITFTGGSFDGHAFAKAAVTATDVTPFIACVATAGSGGGKGGHGDNDGNGDDHGQGDKDDHGQGDKDNHGDNH